MGDDSTTVKFHDYEEQQEGFFVVRKFGDRLSLAFSLEKNGDFEALIDRRAAEELVEAIQKAIR